MYLFPFVRITVEYWSVLISFTVDPYTCGLLFYGTGIVSTVYSHWIRFFLKSHTNQNFLTWNLRSTFNFKNELKIGSRILIIDVPFKFFKFLLRKSRSKFGSEAPPLKIQLRFSIFLHFIGLYLVSKCFSTFGEFSEFFWLSISLILIR